MRSSNYLRQAKRRHCKTVVSDGTDFNPNDKIIGKDTLASILDVTVTCIEIWIRDGMPVEQRGDNIKEWTFEPSKVNQWRQENDNLNNLDHQ